ncbi:MAG: hypothetical protein ACFFEY_20235 [Candidatus Thorarchaeota archaeon]
MSKIELSCKVCGMKFEGNTEEEARKKMMKHAQKAHPKPKEM